ncbi:hypothetical protein [Ktedonospora formicarum]|uniref:hypothetical protein n=1 Tax=Ktedonospora formicarum TaxID=2778364 RepID=UPI001C692229|nr:hypothetical protein [Ktedonospora formicarum]
MKAKTLIGVSSFLQLLPTAQMIGHRAQFFVDGALAASLLRPRELTGDERGVHHALGQLPHVDQAHPKTPIMMGVVHILTILSIT